MDEFPTFSAAKVSLFAAGYNVTEDEVKELVKQWVDIDSSVDSVCGRHEGAAKGYNPRKKGALSYPAVGFPVGQ